MALPQKEIYEVFPDAHSLGSAEDFNRRLAHELATKRKDRQKELGTVEDRGARSAATQMGEAASRLASLPQGYGAFGYGEGRSGIKTDPYLKKTGADYSGRHRTHPVNMDAGLSDHMWVQGAYRSLLGREADQAGLDHWKKDLAGGQTREQVVGNIKRHQEYKDKFLGDAYQNLLGRALEFQADFLKAQNDAFEMPETAKVGVIQIPNANGRIVNVPGRILKDGTKQRATGEVTAAGVNIYQTVDPSLNFISNEDQNKETLEIAGDLAGKYAALNLINKSLGIITDE